MLRFFTQTPRTPRTHLNTPNPPQKNTFCVLMTQEHLLCSILKFYFLIETWTPFVFHFENNTSNKTPEHLLCSDLTRTPFFNFLLWKLAVWYIVFSPGHPEHPEHTRTPQIPFNRKGCSGQIRTQKVFWSHARSICLKMEHKGCSGLNLEVKFQNGTQRMFWCHQNTKGVLLRGIWGVRVCSGCVWIFSKLNS